MLCYAKEKYKQVSNKQEYMELTNDHKQVQEIFCCDEYEIRKTGADIVADKKASRQLVTCHDRFLRIAG